MRRGNTFATDSTPIPIILGECDHSPLVKIIKEQRAKKKTCRLEYL